MAKLGVNIDHVATVRQARGTTEPDPVAAAVLVELAGADSITVHLREDRRHIQDRDVELLRQTIQTRLNLEMAATQQMLGIALKVQPDSVCLVPERREELTTEGGLDVVQHHTSLQPIVQQLQQAGITVSLFIDPELEQVKAAHRLRADAIEIHTGAYCNALLSGRKAELARIETSIRAGNKLGLIVNAGHGLNYHNVQAVVALGGIEEFNIGHSIISRAVLTGLEGAVRDMQALVRAV